MSRNGRALIQISVALSTRWAVQTDFRPSRHTHPMNIGSVPKQQAVDVLERRQWELLSAGDTAAADRVGQDRVTLRDAEGETLYEMHKQAAASLERYERAGDILFHVPVPVLLALPIAGIVAGARLSQAVAPGFVPGLIGAVVGGVASSALAFAPLKIVMDGEERNQAILGALERVGEQLQQAPSSSTIEIPKERALKALRKEEQLQAASGRFRQATAAAKAAERLEQAEGDTLRAVYLDAAERGDRALVEVIDGYAKAILEEAIRAAEHQEEIEAMRSMLEQGTPEGWVQLLEQEVLIGGTALDVRQD